MPVPLNGGLLPDGSYPSLLQSPVPITEIDSFPDVDLSIFATPPSVPIAPIPELRPPGEPIIPAPHAVPHHSSLQVNGKYPVVALGGTFDHLHAGHKILLSMAVWITGRKLIVGVSGTLLVFGW
jgi:hypothetical protein